MALIQNMAEQNPHNFQTAYDNSGESTAGFPPGDPARIAELCRDPVFRHFRELSDIPRGSYQEARAAAFLMKWAKAKGFFAERDAVGNVFVRNYEPSSQEKRSASDSAESAAGVQNGPASDADGRQVEEEFNTGVRGRDPVLLQAHMDMVCVKAPDSDHDFTKDPIRWLIEGDTLSTGRETTLGADDGIGVALAMTALEEAGAEDPPLEALFTVCEEEDLSGALRFDMSKSRARVLINLDHTCAREVLCGSGGGMRADVRIPLMNMPIPEDAAFLTIRISGLTGGHSGDDIDKHRANAIMLLLGLLAEVSKTEAIGIRTLAGGVFRLSIPVSASARIAFSRDNEGRIRETIAQLAGQLTRQYADTDPGMEITWFAEDEDVPFAQAVRTEAASDAGSTEAAKDTVTDTGSAAAAKDTDADTMEPVKESNVSCNTAYNPAPLLALAARFPWGVASMRTDFPEIAAASDNPGELYLKDGVLHLVSEIRACKDHLRDNIFREMEVLAEDLGGSASCSERYPAWESSRENALAEHFREVYEEAYGEKVRVLPIHAGLEVGCLLHGREDLPAVSVGSDLWMLHSIDERLRISSVREFYANLRKVLRRLGGPGKN